MEVIKKVDPNDEHMNSALFRDYSFLSSSYLLEPCHQQYIKDGNYGVGEVFMPKNLSLPMQELANRIHYKKPLLDYAHGYALNNWIIRNDKNPNVRTFHNDEVLPPEGTTVNEHL